MRDVLVWVQVKALQVVEWGGVVLRRPQRRRTAALVLIVVLLAVDELLELRGAGADAVSWP